MGVSVLINLNEERFTLVLSFRPLARYSVSKAKRLIQGTVKKSILGLGYQHHNNMHTIYTCNHESTTCSEKRHEVVSIGYFHQPRQYGAIRSGRNAGRTPRIIANREVSRQMLTTSQKGLLHQNAHPAVLYSIGLLCFSHHTSTDTDALACTYDYHAHCGPLRPN